jgi:hypothetical protein
MAEEIVRPWVQIPILPKRKKEIPKQTGHHNWLMYVIQTSWEAEIRRIKVWGQSGQTVCKTPSLK